MSDQIIVAEDKSLPFKVPAKFSTREEYVKTFKTLAQREVDFLTSIERETLECNYEFDLAQQREITKRIILDIKKSNNFQV